MNTLRRLGGNAKKKETKAAATGAKIALMLNLYMLCFFIFCVKVFAFNRAAKVYIKFYLCKKKV